MSECSQRRAEVTAGATGGYVVELGLPGYTMVKFSRDTFESLQGLLRWWLTDPDATLANRGASAPQ